MSDTLRWKIPGDVFEDGTKLTDWMKIERREPDVAGNSGTHRTGK